MKKTALTLCIVYSFIVFSSTGQNTKNYLSAIKLIGKVKTLSETTYSAIDKFGVIQTTELINKNVTYFNDKGNRMEYDDYKSDGSLNYKQIYEYDSKGNEIGDNGYNSDGSLNYKATNKYDDKGNRIECNQYNPDGSLNIKFIYKFDDKENEIESNQYKSDGSLNYKVTNKYDEKGNRIECDKYKSDGSLEIKLIYKYDEKGNEIEANSGSENKTTFKYEFGETGNWSKRTEFKNSIPLFIIEREIKY